MTFLNPFVLFGLAAAAVPLLLHLLNIRKLRTIEFSTLAFLKELQKNQMRKVKIRQWLLLILRTLLVVLVVLAFSRPALKGTLAGLGTHAKTTVVIILDDTYSMSLQNERGAFMKQARECALRLAGMLKEGDDALLIRLSGLPGATIGEPTHDLQKLRDAIRGTEPSYVQRTVEDALRLASKLLQQSKNFNKEIYVLTDNQRTTLIGSPEAERARRAERLFDANVRLFFVPFSHQPFENIGIAGVDLPPTLYQRGKSFSVNVGVRNYGKTRVQNHLVNLFLDGVRVMQKSVTLEGGASASVNFTATSQHAGFVRGYAELEEDAFVADNDGYFCINVPERINLLLSSSDPKSSAYLRLALSVHATEDAPTLISMKEVPPSQLTYATMIQADVIILSNVASLSASQADQLNEFCSQGGGIILFPGNLVDVGQYNSSLLPKLGLPSFLPIERRKTPGAFLTFAKVDLDHPVFQGMFEAGMGTKKGKKEIESPNVFLSTRFASERDVRSIISLSDESPFMWEKARGGSSTSGNLRRVLGFSAAAVPEWSDFPVKGIFVPILYQAVLYAASGGSTLGGFPSGTVGERIEFPLFTLRKRSGATQPSAAPTVRILDPEGQETLVQPSSQSGGGLPMISFNNASRPGNYAIVRGHDTLAVIPVNVDPAESKTELGTGSEFSAMSESLGIASKAVTTIDNPETIDAAVLQSRFGVELWNYFLIVALVVAVAEMLVAREPKPDHA